MKLIFSEDAWDDYLYWQKEDKKILKRINDLIKDTKMNPGKKGIGKPEILKGFLGYCSKRIDKEHRMVYKVTDETLFIAQLRYHY